MKALKDQKGTRTDNGRNFNAWDLRYENIAVEAKHLGLEPLKIYRGNLWSFIGVFNPETRNFLIFMKNDTPEKSIKKTNHYLSILTACKNSNFNNEPNSRIGLFETPIAGSEEKAIQMLGKEIYKKIENVFVINSNNSTMSSLLLTYNGLGDLIDKEIIPSNPRLPEPSIKKTHSTSAPQDEKVPIKLKERISKETKNAIL